MRLETRLAGGMIAGCKCGVPFNLAIAWDLLCREVYDSRLSTSLADFIVHPSQIGYRVLHSFIMCSNSGMGLSSPPAKMPKFSSFPPMLILPYRRSSIESLHLPAQRSQF